MGPYPYEFRVDCLPEMPFQDVFQCLYCCRYLPGSRDTGAAGTLRRDGGDVFLSGGVRVQATFLPGQRAKRLTTLRHRTLTIVRCIDTAEQQQRWHEKLDYRNRHQLELDMSVDPANEFVFTVDTAHIPLVRHEFGRECPLKPT